MSFPVILLIIFYTTPDSILGHNNGNCEFNGISENQWNTEYINTNAVTDNAVLAHITKSFEPITLLEQQGDFIGATVYNKTIIRFETKNLTYLDFTIDSPNGNLAVVASTFTFKCKNGTSTLRYLVLVRSMNNNNNKPAITEPSYVYEVPKDFIGAIRPLDKQIMVHDYSNNQVVFTMRPEGFFTVTTEALRNKYYSPIFELINPEEFKDGQQFELTAMVAGVDWQYSVKSYVTFNLMNGSSCLHVSCILLVLSIFLCKYV